MFHQQCVIRIVDPLEQRAPNPDGGGGTAPEISGTGAGTSSVPSTILDTGTPTLNTVPPAAVRILVVLGEPQGTGKSLAAFADTRIITVWNAHITVSGLDVQGPPR